jgi:DNA-3-methyladenine glycosylase II
MAQADLSLTVSWQFALDNLRAADPHVAGLIDTLHVTPLTRKPDRDPFSTLARAIVGQQLSNRAATTIWNRIVAQVGGAVTSTRLLAVDAQTLRSCGLSAPKISYVRDLAGRISAGELQPDIWPEMSDDALLDELTSLRGIGKWTAQMYMIFHDARLDVLALDDVALRRAAAVLVGIERPLTPPELAEMAELWRPWRSVASIYLWRSIDGEGIGGNWVP